ncbi:hypothetical protein PCANC_00158 [Puccinia coronata f. sp. avenae]|uniref:Uncharacterized protein n=1 Tax=Puccinia coronata f. sp. avenae TaxID=200324 RepID=A0A2N5S7F4_9BASI|nr:hypothetical protein PCANC_27265 [Puccinia coronata f. sp. avenae]PLW58662.1 hypothetical protein PCANC_00158 [Puccinia coronata f. sp. avenae]
MSCVSNGKSLRNELGAKANQESLKHQDDNCDRGDGSPLNAFVPPGNMSHILSLETCFTLLIRLAAMGYGLANDSSHYNEMCSLEQHSGFSPRIHSTEDALKSYKISCGTLLLSELLNPIGNPSLTKPLERRVRGTPNGALSVKDRH